MVVALLQYVRLRDPRLLPMLGLFACLAYARVASPWPWAFASEVGAVGFGLLEVLLIGREGP
jgi:hypothetical protein